MEMSIEKKGKKEKRHVHRLNYGVKKLEDYLGFAELDNTKIMIFGVTIDTIRYGIVNDKKEVDIFNINDNDRNSVVSLKRSEWAKVLKNAMKFYSKRNEYEKCIDAQELLNIL